MEPSLKTESTPYGLVSGVVLAHFDCIWLNLQRKHTAATHSQYTGTGILALTKTCDLPLQFLESTVQLF
jgi:hypothetical protein